MLFRSPDAGSVKLPFTLRPGEDILRAITKHYVLPMMLLQSADYQARADGSGFLTDDERALVLMQQHDPAFMALAALYTGHPDFDPAALVADLVAAESVPALPVQRYTDTGLFLGAPGVKVLSFLRAENRNWFRLTAYGTTDGEEGLRLHVALVSLHALLLLSPFTVLAEADRLNTFLGQLALRIARSLGEEDVNGVGALSKELRQVMREALTGVAEPIEPDAEEVTDPVEAARLSREEKIRQLVNGGRAS